MLLRLVELHEGSKFQTTHLTLENDFNVFDKFVLHPESVHAIQYILFVGHNMFQNIDLVTITFSYELARDNRKCTYLAFPEEGTMLRPEVIVFDQNFYRSP